MVRISTCLFFTLSYRLNNWNLCVLSMSPKTIFDMVTKQVVSTRLMHIHCKEDNNHPTNEKSQLVENSRKSIY